MNAYGNAEYFWKQQMADNILWNQGITAKARTTYNQNEKRKKKCFFKYIQQFENQRIDNKFNKKHKE